MKTAETALRRNLMILALNYAKKTNRSIATVSRLAHGDSAFFDDLGSCKASITLRKYQEILHYFSNNWPRGVPWPILERIPLRRPRKGGGDE